MYILNEKFLLESTIFQVVASIQNALKLCSNKCRNSFKNGPNYQQQVSVCTSRCKIQKLSIAVGQLQKMAMSNPADKTLQTKMMYFRNKRNNEIMKLQSYNNKLKKRQTTIPVSMSLKPSPDRTDLSKMN